MKRGKRTLRDIALGIVAGSAMALAVGGCSRNLTVSRINSDEKQPNNVWVFFTVEDEDEPVAGLTAEDFDIYEDGKLVSTYESKQVIQNPEVAAVMYTMLLLDMSGSVTESGESDAIVEAAHVFSEKVGATQKVGVYAFDGSEDISSVVQFTEAKASIDGGLDGLRVYKAKDPSTNLNGAVMQGLQQLHKDLEKDKRPLKFGTLVVFTDGTDRAHRVTSEEMLEEMNKEEYENYDIFVIGVGAEIEEGALNEIGRDGTELATDEAKVREAFERVADRIDRQAKRFYLLSYCTPSRSGDHTVRIQANSKDEKGKKNGEGSLEYAFSAEKFGPPPECDAERAPAFRLDKNLSPAPEADDGKGKSKGKAKGSAGFGKKPAQPGGG
jgi:hypothetical protein